MLEGTSLDNHGFTLQVYLRDFNRLEPSEVIHEVNKYIEEACGSSLCSFPTDTAGCLHNQQHISQHLKSLGC